MTLELLLSFINRIAVMGRFGNLPKLTKQQVQNLDGGLARPKYILHIV